MRHERSYSCEGIEEVVVRPYGRGAVFDMLLLIPIYLEEV